MSFVDQMNGSFDVSHWSRKVKRTVPLGGGGGGGGGVVLAALQSTSLMFQRRLPPENEWKFDLVSSDSMELKQLFVH